MAREIKFRAWDKDHLRMIALGSHGELKYDNETAKLVFGENFHDDYTESGTRNFDLMQFTGLRDKAGREIYESDIVKANIEATEESHCGDEFDRGYWMGEVVYQDAGFHIRQANDKYAPMLTNYCIVSLEVIGNVHENPELLTRVLYSP